MKEILAPLLMAIALLLFGSACGSEPEGLQIPEEKLVKVLADIHIAEAAAQQLRGQTKDSVLQVYYQQVCEMHGLEKATLEKTMEGLRRQPERLQALYERTMERMERIAAEGQ